MVQLPAWFTQQAQSHSFGIRGKKNLGTFIRGSFPNALHTGRVGGMAPDTELMRYSVVINQRNMVCPYFLGALRHGGKNIHQTLQEIKAGGGEGKARELLSTWVGVGGEDGRDGTYMESPGWEVEREMEMER